ncbi:hypothetical protein F4809DRAFT_615738 [Biscogniauxia mediterranea]|nr:hypothetical protein F4809DRAFT_615738 [Biscogniauxia mediterranea]
MTNMWDLAVFYTIMPYGETIYVFCYVRDLLLGVEVFFNEGFFGGFFFALGLLS